MLRVSFGWPTLADVAGVGIEPTRSFSPLRVRADRGTAPLMRPGECHRRTCVSVSRYAGRLDQHRCFAHFGLSASADLARGFSLWALGFVLSQGNSFPMADPHTSTFSTADSSRALHHLYSEESAISRIRRLASSANSINAAQLVQRFLKWEILFRKVPQFRNKSVLRSVAHRPEINFS